ncbi:MAG TPA: TIGR00725 family protein [Blastocatellia bacterium]|nr:TIGR00725 family protein [Blastocatellia bacterium]
MDDATTEAASGRSPQATIIGDSDATAEVCTAAERIGEMLARHHVTVVTGGRGGVMEAACRGARRAGGVTVGILPSSDMREANPWCSVVIPTGLGSARNVVNVLAGDFVISIGSSAGTLSELCFAWIHGKPILTLKGYGAWPERLGGEPLDHRATSSITECATLDDLERAVIDICRQQDRRR